jgi:spore germination protein YaaH
MVDGNNSLTNLIENADSILTAVNNIEMEAALYSGVNIDFEGLGLSQRGEELQKVKDNFNNFVIQLSERLKIQGKSLTLTLHAPNSSYKGYDYKTLGQLADKIIIMAHDYGVKPEPDNLVIEAVEEAKKEVSSEKLYLAIVVEHENADSIKTKIGIAKRYGLRGISLWRLGGISDEIWKSIKEVIELRTSP